MIQKLKRILSRAIGPFWAIVENGAHHGDPHGGGPAPVWV